MMLTQRSRTAALLFTLLWTAALAASPQKIKLGTIAPKASSFEKILSTLGPACTAHDVELKIYAGGVRGSEADMVRQMRNGTLDAALLTAPGLSAIDPSVEALQSFPMLFRSLAEVDHVGDQLRPRMEKKLREKGFVVLFWTDAGWVRFFSKRPLGRLENARSAKLFAWAGDLTTIEAYRAAGFQPISLETSDILPSLQTGMIDAVPLPPYFALSTQIFMHAKNMLQLDWAPLVGALVVSEKSWNRLTPEAQREIARAAAEAGRRMKTTNRRESELAVEQMQKHGLRVQRVSQSLEAEWRTLAERSYPRLRGGRIPADLFDEVLRLVAAYRSTKPERAAAK